MGCQQIGQTILSKVMTVITITVMALHLCVCVSMCASTIKVSHHQLMSKQWNTSPQPLPHNKYRHLNVSKLLKNVSYFRCHMHRCHGVLDLPLALLKSTDLTCRTVLFTRFCECLRRFKLEAKFHLESFNPKPFLRVFLTVWEYLFFFFSNCIIMVLNVLSFYYFCNLSTVNQ